MDAKIFKQKAETLIDQFQSLINQMSDRGDSSDESQKVCLQIALNELDSNVSGVEDSDFNIDYKKITKKAFKERCSFQEYGRGKNKRNAIYFDWQSNSEGSGFKYMIKSSILNYKRNELFNVLYDLVVNEKTPYYDAEFRYAETDKERFKVPISG